MNNIQVTVNLEVCGCGGSEGKAREQSERVANILTRVVKGGGGLVVCKQVQKALVLLFVFHFVIVCFFVVFLYCIGRCISQQFEPPRVSTRWWISVLTAGAPTFFNLLPMSRPVDNLLKNILNLLPDNLLNLL